MTQRIVVTLDPDRIAPEAIELGHTLACATGARLTLLAVAHSWQPSERSTSRRARAEEDLACVRERLQRRGHDDVYAHLTVARSIDAALHHAAERPDTGLIVLGPAHHGATGRALGRATAGRFLHGAPSPVAIAPLDYRDPERALDRIGVAFVDTADGVEALRGAAALARWTGARLRIIGVAELGVPPDSVVVGGAGVEALMGRRRDALRTAMEAAVAELCAGIECELVVLESDPVGRLVDASAHVDLLVCGSRAHGPLGSVLLGGVSRALLNRARCPLLIVPRGHEQRLEHLVAPPSAAAR